MSIETMTPKQLLEINLAEYSWIPEQGQYCIYQSIIERLETFQGTCRSSNKEELLNKIKELKDCQNSLSKSAQLIGAIGNQCIIL